MTQHAVLAEVGTAPGQRGRVPAEPEFWIFLLGDLAIFTGFFFVWAVAERAEPEVFDAGRADLALGLGVANTLVLLLSSAAVAVAVASVRHGRPVAARAGYAVAIGCGAVFLVLKAAEYRGHLGHGLSALETAFFVDYFVFTGVHALHVVLGMVALAVARSRAGRGDAPMLVHEAAASWWHVIDIVWIVLFTLIYLG